jgi:hypothetical protein
LGFLWGSKNLTSPLTNPRESHGRVARVFGLTYVLGGKVRRYAIGSAHILSLADARHEAKRALADVARGVDPQLRKVEARSRSTSPDFEALGRRFVYSRRPDLASSTASEYERMPHLHPRLPLSRVAPRSNCGVPT